MMRELSHSVDATVLGSQLLRSTRRRDAQGIPVTVHEYVSLG